MLFECNAIHIYVSIINCKRMVAISAPLLCPELGIPASHPHPSTPNKDTTISHSTSVGLDISLSTLVVGLLPRIR